MPRMHPHKRHGWQVVYRVWFPDGTATDKARFSKKRAKAELIFKEVVALEDLSRRRELPRKDIITYLNLKYISREEAEALANAPLAVTWRELRRKYEDYSRARCAPYTHACNMIKVSGLMKFFEDIDPAAVTPETVDQYINRRLAETVAKGKPDEHGVRKREPVKSATIEKEINTLRVLLDPLGGDKRRRTGIWPENPARQVRPPKMLDERVPRPLWRADIGAFYRALRTHRKKLYGYLPALAMTYLYAGLRPTESVNLTPKDVNLKIRTITVEGKQGVRTKTGRARTVEIHPKLVIYIEACVRKGGRYIFGGEERLNPDSVSRAIRQVIEDSGREGLTPYSLRHTFITGLLRSGADIREVQARAGHRRLSTTMRYLHVAPSQNPVKRIKFKD